MSTCHKEAFINQINIYIADAMNKLSEKNGYSGLEQSHVSVLMTAYNSAPYISKAIESIINQTFKVFEFVIIDDGSTNGTSALINEFAQKDSRVRTIRTKNNGIGAATNRGLRECHGKYIAIMDSDDIAEPCRLESQAAFLDLHLDIAGVGSQWLMIDTERQIVGLDTHSTKPELVEILLFAFFVCTILLLWFAGSRLSLKAQSSTKKWKGCSLNICPVLYCNLGARSL